MKIKKKGEEKKEETRCHERGQRGSPLTKKKEFDYYDYTTFKISSCLPKRTKDYKSRARVSDCRQQQEYGMSLPILKKISTSSSN
jgi:hypothetical protein